MEGYAAILSRDGQGGVLLRDLGKLEKFEDNMIQTLRRTFWNVQQLSAAMAAALIMCTRGEVATLVRRILSVSPGDGLQAWFAVTQWFISPKRTKNVNELHLAVMQWELRLVEHESKFSEVVADSLKTAGFPRMCSRDSSTDLSIVRNFENRVSANVRRETGWTRCERWSSTHGHWADRQVRRSGRRCQCSSTAPLA